MKQMRNLIMALTMTAATGTVTAQETAQKYEFGVYLYEDLQDESKTERDAYIVSLDDRPGTSPSLQIGRYDAGLNLKEARTMVLKPTYQADFSGESENGMVYVAFEDAGEPLTYSFAMWLEGDNMYVAISIIDQNNPEDDNPVEYRNAFAPGERPYNDWHQFLTAARDGRLKLYKQE